MIDAEKYPKVEVEWEDHHGTPTNESVDPRDVENSLRPVNRLSIGWLIAEDEKMMAIAALLEEDHTVCDVTYLIKSCIVTSRYL